MAGNMNTLCAVHTDIAGIGTVTYTATRALRIIDTNVLTSVAGGAGRPTTARSGDPRRPTSAIGRSRST